MEAHTVVTRQADAPHRETNMAPASRGPLGGWIPANPAPLGAAGFAATAFVLSVINANLVGPKSAAVVLPLAAAYGGLAQLLAGMWEFRTGNTFGAVLFGSYGAFWISIYIMLKLPTGAVTPAGFSLYLYAWAIFTVIMFLGSLRTNAVLSGALLLLLIVFVLEAIGQASLVGGTATTNGTIHLGGYVGIALALMAWYLVAAGVLEATFGREVLPVFPLDK
jgi:uncharacterized protein